MSYIRPGHFFNLIVKTLKFVFDYNLCADHRLQMSQIKQLIYAFKKGNFTLNESGTAQIKNISVYLGQVMVNRALVNYGSIKKVRITLKKDKREEVHFVVCRKIPFISYFSLGEYLFFDLSMVGFIRSLKRLV